MGGQPAQAAQHARLGATRVNTAVHNHGGGPNVGGRTDQTRGHVMYHGWPLWNPWKTANHQEHAEKSKKEVGVANGYQ